MASVPLYHLRQGQGAPLIIMHGLFGLADNWKSFQLKWQDRYDVILVDLRNHGRSPHTAEFDYPSMAADILQLLDELNLPQANLLGHSMGGKVAMQLALQQPQRVSRLVVADIAPVDYPPHHTEVLAGLDNVKLDGPTTRQAAEAQLAEFVPDMVTRQFLLKSLNRLDQYHFAWKFNWPIIREKYPEILKGVGGGSYAGPTLFVRGGRSGYVQDSNWPGIQALFPTAQLKTIPEAGHWVHAEAPQAFYDVVNAFLED